MSEVTTGKLAEALSKAQAEYPVIPKDRTVSITSDRGRSYTYNYAEWSTILKAVLPILSKHGLAFSQVTRLKDMKLRLCTRLMHGDEVLESDGIPIAETLDPKTFGGTLTYWKRYDGCALLGIQAEEDLDAPEKKKDKKAEREAQDATAFISKVQVNAFNAACVTGKRTTEEITKYFSDHKIPTIDEMPKADFQMAIKWALNVQEDLTRILQDSVRHVEDKKVSIPSLSFGKERK